MKKVDWKEVWKTMLPICISYIPIGIGCGILLEQAGFGSLAVLLTSLLIYGGASQFMIASMTLGGATLIQVVTMVFFINLRHILMSSSLASKVKTRSTTFNLLFAQTITDESFAINTLEFKTNPNWTSNNALAAGVIAYLTWAASTFVGALVGNNLALSTVVMNYLLVAMFIYLLVSQMENKVFLYTAIFAAVSAVLLKLVFQNGVGVLIASVLASFFGLALELRREEREERERAVHES